QSNWPTDPEYLAAIKENWVEPFGDMRQELVFIGQGLDEAGIRAALDACLLSEEEVLRGRTHWETLNDPFPAWDRG
ncbi:MAG: GTP-binding protein, partial [Pseudomonadota bacterium]